MRFIITLGFVALALLSVGADKSPDSLGYLKAAETFPSYPDDYFNWGPLLPAMLALIPATGVNGLMVAGLVSTVSWLLRDARFWAWFLAVAVVALSQVTQYVYRFVWSEGPFLLFSLGFLLAWAAYLDRRTLAMLVASSILLGATVLTRHIGIVMGVVCCLTVLQTNDSWRWRVRTLFAVGIGPAAIYGGWLVRNVLLFNSPTPEHPDPGWADFFITLANSGDILGHWFVPHWHHGPALWAIAATMIAYVGTQLRADGYACTMAHFVIIYLVAMVVLTSTISIPPMHQRFLAPIFPPTVVLVTWGLDRLYERASPGTRKALEYAVLVWAVLWVSAPGGPINHVMEGIT